MPRAQKSIWQDVLKGILTTAIIATCAAAIDTWVQVKLMRKDLDQMKIEIERLWDQMAERTADQWTIERNVSALAGGPLEQTEFAIRLAEFQRAMRQSSEIAAAAAPAEAAAPEPPK